MSVRSRFGCDAPPAAQSATKPGFGVTNSGHRPPTPPSQSISVDQWPLTPSRSIGINNATWWARPRAAGPLRWTHRAPSLPLGRRPPNSPTGHDPPSSHTISLQKIVRVITVRPFAAPSGTAVHLACGRHRTCDVRSFDRTTSTHKNDGPCLRSAPGHPQPWFLHQP